MNKKFVKGLKLSTSIIILSTISLPALSANWYWLKDTPLEAFTDSDWTMLKQTGTDVLENGADKTTVLWVNEETGHSGTITPLMTKEINGLTCRKTKFFNSADDKTGSASFKVCKQADGEWKIAP